MGRMEVEVGGIWWESCLWDVRLIGDVGEWFGLAGEGGLEWSGSAKKRSPQKYLGRLGKWERGVRLVFVFGGVSVNGVMRSGKVSGGDFGYLVTLLKKKSSGCRIGDWDAKNYFLVGCRIGVGAL